MPLTKNDVRSVSAVVDGSGVTFVAYTEGKDYRAKLIKIDPNGTVTPITNLQGAKHGSLSAVLVGSDVIIYAATRPGVLGDFPLEKHVYRNIATPLGTISSAPSADTAVVDTVARTAAQHAVQQASEAVKLAGDVREIANTALTAARSIQHGVTVKQVEDIAWSKAGDRLFVELQDKNSPLLSVIWQKAKDAAYALLREAGLMK